MPDTNRKRIVIVGGGAGGLELVTKLGKKLGKKQLAQIILVDASLTHFWKPLLHEVAAGTLDSNEDELNYLAHAKRNYYKFIYGKLIGLDRKQQQIKLAAINDETGKEILPIRNIPYDILVLAIGSMTNDFNTPGVKEYCLLLDNRKQADKFHKIFIKKMLQIQSLETPPSLNISIIGAGATGVELAAELHYAIQQTADYSGQSVSKMQHVKINIIEGNNRILSALSPKVSSLTHQELNKLGIHIYVNQRVKEITAEGIHTAQGLFIPSDLKVWAAGIKASDVLTQLDNLEFNKLNQLIVTQTLQTTREPTIFAFGDCAYCPQENRDRSVPPRAQAAHQEADLLATSLIDFLQGKSPRPYYYRDYGSLISLSKYETVGNLMGRAIGNLHIEGAVAKWFYISLYKLHQLAVLGIWRTIILTFGNLLRRRVKPRLKLH